MVKLVQHILTHKVSAMKITDDTQHLQPLEESWRRGSTQQTEIFQVAEPEKILGLAGKGAGGKEMFELPSGCQWGREEAEG